MVRDRPVAKLACKQTSGVRLRSKLVCHPLDKLTDAGRLEILGHAIGGEHESFLWGQRLDEREGPIGQGVRNAKCQG